MKIKTITVLALFLLSWFSLFSQTLVKISPEKKYQTVEGWGSSLCWWAHMVGQWGNESAIDEIVDYITSPDGLNMNIFRYNIGGGDAPSHYSTETTPGHMTRGKGVRAEMQGFKASEFSPYNWEADAGQRKIMLKIKQKRPDAIFEAFSNSPPYWMTYSGCSAGHSEGGKDNLKPEYYGQFCDYLIEVCKFYKDSFNIEFKTLAPFNESTSNFWHNQGSQEGCHFDIRSQIELIKTLHPKLKASKLNTIISASDETNLSAFQTMLRGYVSDSTVLDLVGQLNTHTYSGSDSERKTVKDKVKQLNKPFWQSETGPMGFSSNPFENNLQLAQKLISDMKLMNPQAWLDWQLVEELNNTWCVFRGSFKNETFHKVKNFYVRMQFSRFIKQGYTVIDTDNNNVLAAVNPENTELVLVALNNTANERNFQFDLSLFQKVAETTALYRTSLTEDCTKLSGPSVNQKAINYNAPANTASTIVVKVK